MAYKPKDLKIKLLPCDKCDIPDLISQLERGGFIKVYEAGGVNLIWVVNFKKHQNPHPKEPESQLPEFKGDVELNGETCKETPSNALSNPSLPPSILQSPPSAGDFKSLVKEKFNIIPLLDDKAMERARVAAPGMDIYFLAERYNEGIRNGQREMPDKPKYAFSGWCAAYYKKCRENADAGS